MTVARLAPASLPAMVSLDQTALGPCPQMLLPQRFSPRLLLRRAVSFAHCAPPSGIVGKSVRTPRGVVGRTDTEIVRKALAEKNERTRNNGDRFPDLLSSPFSVSFEEGGGQTYTFPVRAQIKNPCEP